MKWILGLTVFCTIFSVIMGMFEPLFYVLTSFGIVLLTLEGIYYLRG